MGNARVKLKVKGINQVLRSAQPLVDRHARAMAKDAGAGFESVSKPHKWTARGYVQTNSYRGRVRQAREHVLQRVLGSAGS